MALPSTGYGTATITNPGGALTDFTLMIDLSRMHASWWAEVDTADGTKGRASKEDETELATDWIDFNDSLETGWLRVKYSGTLAASGVQDIRIYPPVAANSSNAPGATYGSDNAYDANWEGYWPDGGGDDRTSNGLDLTQHSITAGDSTGKVGRGTGYLGKGVSGDDYADVAVSGVSEPITLMGWAKDDTSNHNDEDIMGLADKDVTGKYHRMIALGTENDGNSYVQAFTFDGSTAGASDQLTGDWTSWHHATAVFASGSSRSAYADATAPTANTDSRTVTGIDLLSVGRAGDSTPRGYFDGILNELQFHSVVRVADWIAEEYAQTNDNATFWGSWGWTAGAAGAAQPWLTNKTRRFQHMIVR